MRKHCKENDYLYAFINNPVYITKKTKNWKTFCNTQQPREFRADKNR